MKQTAKYFANLYNHIKVGQSAIVFPYSHPDADNVSGNTYVRTSQVISHDKVTGIFETKNTIYHPHE